MTFFIPIFPLQIVVYPGEKLNLHIFEPQYKQMITDCITHQKPFGICTVIDNKIQEVGVKIEQIELIKKYDSGALDIKTTASTLFSIIEIVETIPEKLYKGAIVTTLANDPNRFIIKRDIVMQDLRELHDKLGIHKQFTKPDEQLSAFDIAHYVGLSLQQEYDVLTLPQESQQWEYLLRHLKALYSQLEKPEFKKRQIAIVQNVQRNGHFRDLSLKDFLK